MSSSKTDHRPPRAADKIRETARRLFYTQGIRAVGVDQIVQEAGVTKPSLYRAYPSKDALAAAYLSDWSDGFFQRFDAALAKHPDDPAAGVVQWFEDFIARAGSGSYRGCGLSNAAVEYPECNHPARRVAEANKGELRGRLRNLAMQMGASEPGALADGLLLLMEGCFITGQLFREDGPALAAPAVARALIAHHITVGRPGNSP
ncbi:MAG: TetR/AcrR family transcriptional regulator [Caulobacteraceae bacterium]|nr:MAG: TetR/AcrR family transcriptional regulator [Caulobacteraceae bacterium]